MTTPDPGAPPAASPDDPVEAYFAAAPEPQRSTLLAMRATLAQSLPDAEQVLSYGVPTFKVRGKGVAGLASYAQHCGYLPMSGSVTAALADRLAGFSVTKGSVRVPADRPLPDDLIEALVDARLAELGLTR
jgi:uncharacterized protein YdhG (YjbR/CyaY superfamily)